MIDPTKSPAYCIRRVGCGLIFSYFISRREFIVAGNHLTFLTLKNIYKYEKSPNDCRGEAMIRVSLKVYNYKEE